MFDELTSEQLSELSRKLYKGWREAYYIWMRTGAEDYKELELELSSLFVGIDNIRLTRMKA